MEEVNQEESVCTQQELVIEVAIFTVQVQQTKSVLRSRKKRVSNITNNLSLELQ